MFALWYLTLAIEDYRTSQSSGSKAHESKINTSNIVKPVVPAKNVTLPPATNNIQNENKPVEIPIKTATTTPIIKPDVPKPNTVVGPASTPLAPVVASPPSPTPRSPVPVKAPVLPKPIQQTRDPLDTKLMEFGQKLNETKRDMESNVSTLKDPMDQKLAEISSKINEKREQAKSVFEKSSAQLAELYSDKDSASDESQSDA